MTSESMINEIRIYYESLEQCLNYIKPIIEQGLNKNKINCDLKLIRLKGNYEYYSKHIAPIIFWKDPDILITVIIDDVEYPLIVLEFSNAVFTEDHELQRFDGLVASAENNCIYAKISPINKISTNVHGGNVNFDYVGPFSVVLNKYKKVFYHFNWPCKTSGVVEVDSKYLSIPPKIQEFNLFIELLLDKITKKFDSNKWIGDLELELEKNKYFVDWKTKLINYKLKDIALANSTRTEWISSTKTLILKLNRFGHAMDPERGMLSYYGTLYNNIFSKMMFNTQNNSWYKDIPKEQEINTYISRNNLKKAYDFLYCFTLGSGLYSNKEFLEIIKEQETNKSDYIELDLTTFLNSNYLFLNKAMRTIFKNSNGLIIVDKDNNLKIKFIWKLFNKQENYFKYPDKTNIIPKTYFDEDDVTYIAVHDILIKNGYIVIAASYPGAQADRAVLIEPENGRKQKRRYIDIISYLPNRFTVLQENKGKFSPISIQPEIIELRKYKSNQNYIAAINTFITKFDSNAPKLIKIGVGFWANTKFKVSKIINMDIKDLDYFIYLTSDMTEWYIWSTGNKSMFKVTNGNISIKKVYEVVKN